MKKVRPTAYEQAQPLVDALGIREWFESQQPEKGLKSIRKYTVTFVAGIPKCIVSGVEGEDVGISHGTYVDMVQSNQNR